VKAVNFVPAIKAKRERRAISDGRRLSVIRAKYDKEDASALSIDATAGRMLE
jgi:hypothetical protein